MGAGPVDLHNLKSVGQLTKEEIIRACRISIIAELDAINLYEMIADSSDDPLVSDTMRHVAEEEMNHVGEFLKLIHHLEPDEIDVHYEKGKQEVAQRMGSQGGPRPGSKDLEQHTAPTFAQDQYGQFEEKHRRDLENLNEEISSLLNKEHK